MKKKLFLVIATILRQITIGFRPIKYHRVETAEIKVLERSFLLGHISNDN